MRRPARSPPSRYCFLSVSGNALSSFSYSQLTCFKSHFPFGHRYLPKFSKVDKHSQIRQHELNAEGKWGTDDAFFRLFCTLLGMATVDKVLAVKAESAI